MSEFAPARPTAIPAQATTYFRPARENCLFISGRRRLELPGYARENTVNLVAGRSGRRFDDWDDISRVRNAKNRGPLV